jgi:hypothetical protein
MAKSAVKFTGSLYQLVSRRKLWVGAYVQVNGPHDTFGVVQKITDQPSGDYLNLIRGTRPHSEHTIAANF